MSKGDADECFGIHGAQALDHVAAAHAGVDEDGDRADFVEGEGEDEEFGRGADHEDGTRAAGDAGGLEAEGAGVGFGVELFEGVVRVNGAAVRVAAGAPDDGGFLGLLGGAEGEPGGDVEKA